MEGLEAPGGMIIKKETARIEYERSTQLG